MYTIRPTNIAIFHEMTISRACIALVVVGLGLSNVLVRTRVESGG